MLEAKVKVTTIKVSIIVLVKILAMTKSCSCYWSTYRHGSSPRELYAGDKFKTELSSTFGEL